MWNRFNKIIFFNNIKSKTTKETNNMLKFLIAKFIERKDVEPLHSSRSLLFDNSEEDFGDVMRIDDHSKQAAKDQVKAIFAQQNSRSNSGAKEF